MFKKKQEVYSIKEFMSGEHKKPKNGFSKKLGYTVPLFIVPATPAFAASPQQTIMHAFDPLIDMIQSLAYPIAGVMLAGGCLYIMCGFKDKGMDMIKNACIGYILVMLSPMFLKILIQMGAQIL